MEAISVRKLSAWALLARGEEFDLRRLGEAQRNVEVAKRDMHCFGSQVSFFDTLRDNCLEREIMASIGDAELGSPGGVEKGTGANAPAGGGKEAVSEQQKSGGKTGQASKKGA